MSVFFQHLVLVSSVACLGAFAVSGCSQNQKTASTVNHPVLSAEAIPNGIPVGEARSMVKDGDEVAVVGLIGGSGKPFTAGLAAFTIVDPKVPYCSAKEGCPTPWDYCCEQDAVKTNIALIKVVDSDGNVLEKDAKSLLSIKELAKVTVQGKANRDEAGNMTILASRIHIDQ